MDHYSSVLTDIKVINYRFHMGAAIILDQRIAVSARLMVNGQKAWPVPLVANLKFTKEVTLHILYMIRKKLCVIMYNGAIDGQILVLTKFAKLRISVIIYYPTLTNPP